MQLKGSFTGKQKTLVKTRRENGKIKEGTAVQGKKLAFPVAIYPFIPLDKVPKSDEKEPHKF